ncbi:nicotinamidase [Methylobacterium sp. Leaf104]|uniref:bifunctional nicotinamidase/pyrazinamidase n=1 Tax=Methylobacterium TaxID=407 RepID=UPI0006F40DB0|nr:bifunctional nicotinamidase/pyrazinamidase [Methylobacterium sp. Leaf104]KQP30055.1 nicotinamidase [Methylobacterium sp. Leaf104]MCI9881451.1 bifunctional nicotinamidase/pyrazinamidase [Methylobacterium goesingense]
MIPGARDVLLVIDVQVDFLPGGALAVPDGDAVVAPVNRLLGLFPHAVLTQDWHPPGHVSFATSHPGRAPFDTVPLAYGPQVLWPEHCVQGSAGAALAPGLAADRAELVIRKGHHRRVDSYSAFLEADRRTPTGLAGYLRERGFTRVILCGLATDYCVAWSALDARAAGFEALVVADAVRGIDLDGSVARAWADMQAAGVTRITSGAIGGG